MEPYLLVLICLSECSVEKAVLLALLDSCSGSGGVAPRVYKRVKWLKEADCGRCTHVLRRNTIYIHAEGEAVISEESRGSSCLHLKGRANADRVSMQHIRFTQGF